MKHSHYFKDVSRLSHIDVYRVLELFAVTDPCLQHAIKKLLVAGNRGVKNMDKDIQEAIDTLERWKAMRVEDGLGGVGQVDPKIEAMKLRRQYADELQRLAELPSEPITAEDPLSPTWPGKVWRAVEPADGKAAGQ